MGVAGHVDVGPDGLVAAGEADGVDEMGAGVDQRSAGDGGGADDVKRRPGVDQSAGRAPPAEAADRRPETRPAGAAHRQQDDGAAQIQHGAGAARRAQSALIVRLSKPSIGFGSRSMDSCLDSSST